MYLLYRLLLCLGTVICWFRFPTPCFCSLYCLCNDHHECAPLFSANITQEILSEPGLPNDIRALLLLKDSELVKNALVNTEELPRNRVIMDTLGVCRLKRPSEGHCFKALSVTPMNTDDHLYGITVNFGCISETGISLLACKSHMSDDPEQPKTMSCCDKGALCNSRLRPQFHQFPNATVAVEETEKRFPIPPSLFPTTTTEGPVDHSTPASGKWRLSQILLVVALSTFFMALVVVLGLLCRILFRNYKRFEGLSHPSPVSPCCPCLPFLGFVFSISKWQAAGVHSRANYQCQPHAPRFHLISHLSTESPNSELQVPPPPSTSSQQPLLPNCKKNNIRAAPPSSSIFPSAMSPDAGTESLLLCVPHNGQPSSGTATGGAGGGGGVNHSHSTHLSSSEVAAFLPRTVSLQVDIGECLGGGRFSQVHLGELYAESVVVRVFCADSAASHAYWAQEVRVMQAAQLTHDHVTHLLGVDQLLWNDATLRRILLLPYYPLRDLRHFCMHYFASPPVSSSSSVSPPVYTATLHCGEADVVAMRQIHVLLQLMLGVVSGLTYLHSDISGSRGKPPIAHRNVKMSNVYITSRGANSGSNEIGPFSACIGDFGLSIIYQSQEQTQPSPSSSMFSSPQMTASTSVATMDSGTTLLTSPSAYSASLTSHEGAPWLPLPGGDVLVTDTDYASPEILDGSLPVTVFDAFLKADLYALGVTMWRLSRWWLHRFHVPLSSSNSHPNSHDVDFLPDYWLLRSPSSPFPALLTPAQKETLLQSASSSVARPVAKLEDILRECTLPQSALRLPALRVKKSMTTLLNELRQHKEGSDTVVV